MRIVSKVITVVATSIVVLTGVWSVVIFSSPYENQLISTLDTLESTVDEKVDDPKLYGSWENAYQQVRFDADGSFDNEIDVGDEDDGKEAVFLDDLTEGDYKATDHNICFGVSINLDSDISPTVCAFGYHFEDNDNYLYITNATNYSWFLSRNINRVRNYEEMVNYSNEKVNISGNLVVENETNGYLTVNESGNETEVLIFFEGYNETNVTEFDGQNVSIIGYLYITCDCDYWEGPCVKDIELIELTN